MLNKLEEKFDLVYYLLIYNRIFSKFPRIRIGEFYIYTFTFITFIRGTSKFSKRG